MKKYLLIALLAALSFAGIAQRIHGTITGNDGQAIEYVNIGIPTMAHGTVSDASGAFEISLPDSLDSQMLRFSHIAYEPKDIPVAEIKREFAHSNSVRIVLDKRYLALSEVVVHHNKGKEINVNSKGMPFPGGNAEFSGLGGEIGSLITPKKRIQINKILFSIKKSLYDTAIIRINIYNIKNDTIFMNMLTSPIYREMLRTKGKATFDIDISNREICFETDKTYYISAELVHFSGKGKILFPLYISKSRFRSTSQSPLEEIPFNIGILIKGDEVTN